MEWTRGPILGRGSSATVSAATSTSGDVFAVKSVEFRLAESLQKEQQMLSMLKSPYVVSYKGCDTTIEDNKTIYNIFLDYMSGGSISDLINRRNGVGLTDSEIARYTRQIVQGLDYIHSNGIVHCDIKGANILINESGTKIGDFGCAKWARSNKLALAHLAQSPTCGTPMYMAPETARGEDQGFPADVWALGCTVIEMATGGSPWPDVNDPVSVLYKIAFSDEIPAIPDEISDQAKDFITKCLIRDPKQRWTAAELLKHPYINIQDQESDNSNHIIISEKTITYSPTSILDQDVWNSIKEPLSSSWVSIDFPQLDGILISNNLRQRIKQLADKSEIPKWLCEKEETGWVTIR